MFKGAMGRLDSGLRLIGFKTLAASSKNALDWLHSTFPCARFVVNWRNDTNAEFKSKPFFKNNGLTVEMLNQQNKVLQHFVTENPVGAFALPLEVLYLSAYL